MRNTDVQAFKIGTGAEVDNTGDSVGTVSSARTASQYVYTLKQRYRDDVKVCATLKVGWHNASAVQQGDVTIAAKATQIDKRRTTVTVVY